MTALHMIYRSVQDRLPFGYDEFAAAVKDWEIVPVEQRGKLFGGVMVKGNEIHVGLKYGSPSVVSFRIVIFFYVNQF